MRKTFQNRLRKLLKPGRKKSILKLNLNDRRNKNILFCHHRDYADLLNSLRDAMRTSWKEEPMKQKYKMMLTS